MLKIGVLNVQRCKHQIERYELKEKDVEVGSMILSEPLL